MPGEFPTEASQPGYSTPGNSQGMGHNNQVGTTRDDTINPAKNVSTGYGASSGTPNVASHGTGVTGTSTTATSGPHSSNLANRADPRVGSENSRMAGFGLTGYDSSTGHGASRVPDSTTTGSTPGTVQIGGSSTDRSYYLGSGTSSSTATGPHSSNLANKADPRIDSDLDGSRTMGNTAGTAVISGTTTARSFPLAGTSSSTTSGPHSSNLANRADPRVDSDNSRTSSTGFTGTGYGNTGPSNTHGSSTHGVGHNLERDAATAGTSSSTTSGPHSSNLANRADPRVDSDNSRIGSTGLTGTGLTGSTSGTGYGNTGSSSTYGNPTHGSGHNLERDAAAAGTGAILGSTASRGNPTNSGVSSFIFSRLNTY
jgi:hypothetical protein